MNTSLSLDFTRPGDDQVYEVEVEISIDPGVRTFSNGDPGYPGSTELEVLKVCGEDGKQIDGFKFSDKELEELENRAIEAVEEAEQRAIDEWDDRREARRDYAE